MHGWLTHLVSISSELLIWGEESSGLAEDGTSKGLGVIKVVSDSGSSHEGNSNEK